MDETEALKKLIRDAVGFPWNLLVVFIIAGAGGYLGAYLRRKGENLATKEDIKELTDIQEQVKQQHAREFEALAQANREILARYSREHQLRLAAIDQRLSAHQQAFARWRKLSSNVHSPNIGEIVLECQTWWEQNCLYLEPESREAFAKAYNAAFIHKDLLAGRLPASEITQNMDIVRAAGPVIVRSVELPAITEDQDKSAAPFPK